MSLSVLDAGSATKLHGSVLVVDDDVGLQTTLCDILTLVGLNVSGVGSAREATGWCDDHTPDLVVLDQRLPDGSGLQLAALLRAQLPLVPIVLLTGYVSAQSAIAAVGMVDDYLTKPVPPAELIKVVQTRLEQHRLRIANQALLAQLGEANTRLEQTVEERTRQLRVARDEAMEANNAKSEFLARMSHELRTPLTAVLGFGQLLDRQLPNSEYSTYIGHILNGGRHLLALINDILDITRIEAGEMSVSIEPVPLDGVVQETVDLIRPLANTAQVTLITDCARYQAVVKADRQRLRQILLNLLSNAVKYNHQQGHVWVETSLSGPNELTLSVRDDGPGIAADLQRRVFTPFDRLGAEAGNIEGTGIGLSHTRALTELMGGRIALSSAPGEGCRFTVTLPRVNIEGPGSSVDLSVTSPLKNRPNPNGTATLLHIEDNEPNVRVVENLLKLRPGWSLIHAALGTLGLELAQAHLPDLILLDLHLPDRSGQSVLACIKKNPRTATIPVAILTADTNAGQAQQLLAAGAEDYLTKPLDIDVVLALLDRAATRTADRV
jgi:signal transduction histidine kinase